jgi:FtsP/CotA-like multicopper oxidase with cupredoxin domain
MFYGCAQALDPLTIPKYAIPLVIPPVMNTNGAANNYDIAMKQFKQQILPGGIWDNFGLRDPAAASFPATTVWSYGPAGDPEPDSSGLGGGVGVAPATNSQYNYPAYTIETTNGGALPGGGYNKNLLNIKWINGLKENFGAGPNYLPHLLPVDQTLHWANPAADCVNGIRHTDCMGTNPNYYTGPVPMIPHVHGGHTDPNSDGYAEAWWLPDPTGSNFGCATNAALADGITSFMCNGTFVNNLGPATNPTPTSGFANFTYNNDQPSATIWYHDHSLGMTRSNVYAGPAGFFLIRSATGSEDGLGAGMVLPGPAPVAGETLATTNLPASLNGSREKYREIPIVIQDRSFITKINDPANPADDESRLFYPADRAFFEDLGEGFGGINTANNAGEGLNITTIPATTSDIAPIWNPEAFFNTMVVNGVTWPVQEVAPALYRFRLLNGCNSRFLNLALIVTDPVTGAPTSVIRTVWNDTPGGTIITQTPTSELSFFQIGTEQGLLPQVVKVETGGATTLPGNGSIPPVKPAPDPQQALLMGLAERADVIVDFRGLPNGTVVRLINTAPDAPFGGFPDVPANPDTTGQVMQFVVNNGLLGAPLGSPTDELRDANTGALLNPGTRATPPANLVLGPADAPIGSASVQRSLALLEEESALVCVLINAVTGEITQVPGAVAPACEEGHPEAEAFAPKAAVLGTVDIQSGVPSVQLWSDPITTNPQLDTTEIWDIQNFTADAHPIHLHLVKFNVVGRAALGGGPTVGGDPANNGRQEWESGWKDTVVTYPGESTKVVSTFDIPGLYVWHCHIVEHEDNEMMVPYCVGNPANCNLPSATPALVNSFTQRGVISTGLTQ